jgi:hypothetical protein
MSHTRARHRAPLRTLLAVGLSAGLALSAAAPVQALTAADTERASAAGSRSATWLARQLGPDHLVHGEYQDFQTGEWVSYVDHGLSLDLVHSFRRLGGHRADQAAILDAMKAEQDSYTGKGSYAGPLGKLTHAVVSAGRDIDAYGDGMLDDQLLARIVTEPGTEHGRGKDLVDPTDEFSADYSNTIGQSFDVRALAALGTRGADLLDDATSFLLQQQCEAGFFREGMDGVDHSCDASAPADRAASVDATAFAVRALLEARRAGVTGLGDDVQDAVSWLVRRQRLDGSFVGNGAANADSTGLAAFVLAATGRRGAAGNAAAWVRRHQVDALVVKQHPKLKGALGAVAYSSADLKDGEKNGISRAGRRTWQRATAEGALALPSLLPRKVIDVVAPDRARRGTRVTVTIRGLVAGEVWKIRRAGTLLQRGLVPSNGTVRTTVVLPQRRTKVTLVGVGSRASRRGTETIVVR